MYTLQDWYGQAEFCRELLLKQFVPWGWQNWPEVVRLSVALGKTKSSSCALYWMEQLFIVEKKKLR